MEIKVKSAVKYVLSEKARLSRLLYGNLQALDGDRVLGAHIYIALSRANGISRDGHRLNDAVRVSLEHRTVP